MVKFLHVQRAGVERLLNGHPPTVYDLSGLPPLGSNTPSGFVVFEVDDSGRLELLFVSYLGEGRDEWALKATPTQHELVMGLKHRDLLSPRVKEHLRGFVRESEYAYDWVRMFPEDRDVMRSLITESEYANRWTTLFPGDREELRQYIDEFDDAVAWGIRFHGDHKRMLAVMIKRHAEIVANHTRAPILFKSQIERHLSKALNWVREFPRDRGIVRRWFNHPVAFETDLAKKWLARYPGDKNYIQLPADRNKIVVLTRPAASGSGKIKVRRTY